MKVKIIMTKFNSAATQMKALKPKKNRPGESLVMALEVPEALFMAFNVEVRWNEEIRYKLSEIARALSAARLRAPTTSLYRALKTPISSAAYVFDKLWNFADAPVAIYNLKNVDTGAKEIGRIMRSWLHAALIPFCKANEVCLAAVDGLAELIEREPVCKCNILNDESNHAAYGPRKSAIFSQIGSALHGKPLLAELGPFMVFEEPGTDVLELISPEITWSMGKRQITGAIVFQIKVITVPGTNKTAVVLSGHRREWAQTPPSYGKAKCNAFLLIPGEQRAYKIGFPPEGKPLDIAWHLPTFLDAQRHSSTMRLDRADIGSAIGNSAKLLRPCKGASRKLGRSLPYADLSAAFLQLMELLQPAGFRLLCEIREREPAGLVRSDKVVLPMLKSNRMAEFLSSAEDVLSPRQRDLFNDPDMSAKLASLLDAFGKAEQAPGSVTSNGLNAADWHDFASKFRRKARKLAILAKNEGDRTALRNLIPLFFTDKFFTDIVVYKLPPDVHGLLPPERGKWVPEEDRFADRVKAWRPIISRMREDEITDVLVVAHKEVDGKAEDAVNKKAAKFVFAGANIRSQYLIPKPEKSVDDTKESDSYFQRVLGALRDLCFGQSGIVLLPEKLAEMVTTAGFNTRHLYAISYIVRMKENQKNPAVAMIVCTRMNLQTGVLEAIICGRNNDAWMPYDQVLIEVAKTCPSDQLGETPAKQKMMAGAYIAKLLTKISNSDPEAIVFVDKISGGLRNYWNWLKNGNITGPVHVDEVATKNKKWSSMTFVVVDSKEAPVIAKKGEYGFSGTASLTEEVVAEPDFSVYWYQASNRSSVQVNRQSCYNVAEGKKLQPGDSFMMPRPIQLAIRSPGLTAAKSKFLVDLFATLRTVQATYRDETTWPSPLFEHGRLSADMCRFKHTGNNKFRIEFDEPVEEDCD